MQGRRPAATNKLASVAPENIEGNHAVAMSLLFCGGPKGQSIDGHGDGILLRAGFAHHSGLPSLQVPVRMQDCVVSMSATVAAVSRPSASSMPGEVAAAVQDRLCYESAKLSE